MKKPFITIYDVWPGLTPDDYNQHVFNLGIWYCERIGPRTSRWYRTPMYWGWWRRQMENFNKRMINAYKGGIEATPEVDFERFFKAYFKLFPFYPSEALVKEFCNQYNMKYANTEQEGTEID